MSIMFRCLNRATSTNKVYLSQNVCRAAIFHGRLMSQQAKIKPELKDQKPTSQRLSNEQQVPSEPGKSIDQPTPIEQPLNDQQVALEHQPNDLQLPYERVPIVQYPPNYQIPTHESQAVWRRIYHLHEMKYFSIISKLKFLPIITGVVLSPIGGILQILEILPNTTSSIITAPLILGVGKTALLCAYSKLLSNTVGIINTDSTKKNLQLFYIDFMANRQCIEASVAEIRKMKQYTPNHGYYKVVEMRNEDIHIDLKVPLKRVHILDGSLCRKIFQNTKLKTE